MGDPPTFAQSAGVINLSGIPPNWDKALPAAQRFVVLASFNNDEVRDDNTGLVWEKFPQAPIATWNGTRFTCINTNVGGQKGWRLPSLSDLASVIAPSVASPGQTLPSGHPFQNVQSAGYWSATTSTEDASDAWFVYFGMGFVDHDSKTPHRPCLVCPRQHERGCILTKRARRAGKARAESKGRSVTERGGQGARHEGPRLDVSGTSNLGRHMLAPAHLARPAFPARRASTACLARHTEQFEIQNTASIRGCLRNRG